MPTLWTVSKFTLSIMKKQQKLLPITPPWDAVNALPEDLTFATKVMDQLLHKHAAKIQHAVNSLIQLGLAPKLTPTSSMLSPSVHRRKRTAVRSPITFSMELTTQLMEILVSKAWKRERPAPSISTLLTEPLASLSTTNLSMLMAWWMSLTSSTPRSTSTTLQKEPWPLSVLQNPLRLHR